MESQFRETLSRFLKIKKIESATSKEIIDLMVEYLGIKNINEKEAVLLVTQANLLDFNISKHGRGEDLEIQSITEETTNQELIWQLNSNMYTEMCYKLEEDELEED